MTGSDEHTTEWEIANCLDGFSGRGDISARDRQRLLDEGWEPFAVSDGSIWFRRIRMGDENA